MRVVIPTFPASSDVAHLTLRAEGVSHEVRCCESATAYARLLAELWGRGEGLVVVEHDIAPWAGAVSQLARCPADWCMFRYPKHGGHLIRGLGCAKFSARLVQAHPDLPTRWEGVEWTVLDGVVGSAVAEALRGEDPDRHPLCTHGPPVAHARRTGD